MKALIPILAALLVGCSKQVSNDTGSGFPQGTKQIVAPGNRYTWVIPITLDDGTKCVVTAASGSSAGHVSCNWSQVRP